MDITLQLGEWYVRRDGVRVQIVAELDQIEYGGKTEPLKCQAALSNRGHTYAYDGSTFDGAADLDIVADSWGPGVRRNGWEKLWDKAPPNMNEAARLDYLGLDPHRWTSAVCLENVLTNYDELMYYMANALHYAYRRGQREGPDGTFPNSS